MSNLMIAELSLLQYSDKQSNQSDSGDNGLTDIVQYFISGRFEAILSHEIGEKLLRDNPQQKQNIEDVISLNVERYIQNANKDTEMLQLDVLLVGAACLQLFIQNNWTGPLTDTPASAHIPQSLAASHKSLRELILSELSLDGAPVYGLARHILYLYLARIILLDCRELIKNLQTADWWLMRYISVHQDLLEEKSPSLKATVLEVMDEVTKKEPLMTSDENKNTATLFYLEAGHLCHTFYEYKRAAEYFNTAKKLSGLQIGLTGAMGKRTKFQVDAKAQLMLKITRTEAANVREKDADEGKMLPKNVPLDDDTVLDRVKLSEEDEQFCVTMTQLEQAIVFGVMESYKRSRAMERLTEEEILTYVVGLVDHMSCWSLGTSCLAYRSKLQWDSRRRVERSMNQYEELINQIGKADPPVHQRLNLFFASKMPNIWTLQKSLATLLLSLGLVGDGLKIYERLEMWEEAIACYQQMGKTEQAQSVIRQQLAIKETANLYCFLGDVTRNLEHYQKAWEISNRRSARAMRCMGYLHFANKQYKEAMECFDKSLKVNALQIPVWFTYGCTAMMEEVYEEATKAFRRCVNIETDNFEAWANLSTCLVRLNKKPAAFTVLKDAIKCNYEDWRLWENFVTIGTDCGEFEEVIRGYHRLIDIKEKWNDAPVLEVLVRAVTENIEDSKGRPSSRLRPKVQELFGRVTSTVTNDGEIWRLYSKLISSVEDPDATTTERAIQYLQKAHRCVMQKCDWEKNLDQSVKVAQQSLQLGKEHLKFAGMCPAAQAITGLSSAKLMLRSVLAKLKQGHTDSVQTSLPEKLQAQYQQLEDCLTSIVNKIDELKGT